MRTLNHASASGTPGARHNPAARLLGFTTRASGILLLLGGAICLSLASGWSDTVAGRVKHYVTGDYSSSTVWLGLLGATAIVAGFVTVGVGFRKAAA